MREPIIIDVIYTADDYARGSLFVARRKWWVRYLYLLVLAAIWVLAAGFFWSSAVGRETLERNWLPMIIASAFIIVFGMFNSQRTSNGALRRQFQKQIDSSPAMQEPKHLSIDESGFSSIQNLGSGDLSWAAVIEVVETPADFFFFTSKDNAQFIPKHAFAGDVVSEARLRAILRAQFGDNAKLLQ